jgi:hypothetical protein
MRSRQSRTSTCFTEAPPIRRVRQRDCCLSIQFHLHPLLVGGQAAQVPLKELDGKPEPYDTPTLSDPSLERSRLLDFAEDVPTTKADDWGLYN